MLYEVVLNETKNTDIINFYNEMFIPTFKTFLMNL